MAYLLSPLLLLGTQVTQDMLELYWHPIHVDPFWIDINYSDFLYLMTFHRML